MPIPCPRCGSRLTPAGGGTWACEACGQVVTSTAWAREPAPRPPAPVEFEEVPHPAPVAPAATPLPPADVDLLPRIPEQAFWGAPRPPPEMPFLWWAGSRRHRLALLQLGVGVFSVFVVFNNFLVLQIVMGAPVFEEMLKFGLALLLVAWLPQGHGPARVLVVLARVVAGLAVGAGFGVLEHHVTYSDEPAYSYAWRISFHAIAPAVSMATYSALEPMWDVRCRWLSVVPSILAHYANNALGIVVALLTLGLLSPVVWSGLVVVALLASGVAILAAPSLARRWAGRLVSQRFPLLPSQWAGPPARAS